MKAVSYFGSECEMDEDLGTYSRNNNTITYDVGSESGTAEILTLTSNHLKLKMEISVAGESIIMHTNFVRE